MKLYISQHLMALRQAEILQDRRDGGGCVHSRSDPRAYATGYGWLIAARS